MSGRIGLWLCRRGFHSLLEPGNCIRCGFRGHGGHVGYYAEWAGHGGRCVVCGGRAGPLRRGAAVTTATKIVLFWAALFVLMIPSTFLGWRWSVGVACGFGLACLLAWREFRP